MTITYDGPPDTFTVALQGGEIAGLRRYRARLKVSAGGPVSPKEALTRLLSDAWAQAMRWTDEQTKLAREKALAAATAAQLAAAVAAHDAAIGFDPEG